MEKVQVDMEVMRVRNVVEAMGWTFSKQEMAESKVILTLVKDIEFPGVEVDKGAS